MRLKINSIPYLLAALILLVIFFSIFRVSSSLKIILTGDYDHSLTIVRIDGKRIYSKDFGGNEYVVRTNPGIHTITVTGRSIEKITEKVSVGIGKTTSKEIKMVDINKADLYIKATQTNLNKEYLSLVELDDNWTVVIANPEEDKNTPRLLYLLKHDIKSGEWTKVESGETINLNSKSLNDAPADIKTYIRELNEDE